MFTYTCILEYHLTNGGTWWNGDGGTSIELIQVRLAGFPYLATQELSGTENGLTAVYNENFTWEIRPVSLN
jgi:hypothetical protein